VTVPRFGPQFPYVFIAAGACDAQPLHYRGNAEILSPSGCIEFGATLVRK
jgi:hypothetical protein